MISLLLDLYTIIVYNIFKEGIDLKKRILVNKLISAGFSLERQGSNHEIYRRGKDIEQIPRHVEINEKLAKMILKKWNIK